MAINRITLIGVPVDIIQPENLESEILELLAKPGTKQIVFLSIWNLLRARHKGAFADCVKNYALYNDTKGLPIIGERDITDLSFMFYSSPRIVMIRFLKKPWLVELFSTSVYQRFHNLQKQINSFGYITRDLS